jgi:hypothetical protein
LALLIRTSRSSITRISFMPFNLGILAPAHAGTGCHR